MPLITISRQFGSGGSEIAERVARSLDWHLYDNAVVDEVARRLGMTAAEVSAREERIPSLPERIASAMALGMPEVMPTTSPASSARKMVSVRARSCAANSSRARRSTSVRSRP